MPAKAIFDGLETEVWICKSAAFKTVTLKKYPFLSTKHRKKKNVTVEKKFSCVQGGLNVERIKVRLTSSHKR